MYLNFGKNVLVTIATAMLVSVYIGGLIIGKWTQKRARKLREETKKRDDHTKRIRRQRMTTDAD